LLCLVMLDPNELKTVDGQYFSSYSHLGIHEEMLADSVRTGTYKNAILSNSHLFKGKSVLDVGAGTGILSLFCVLAGAKKVYAVEASNVADYTRLVVEQHKLSSRIIVMKSKMEDVQLEEKVDIIISEWMGYLLLYESMLDSVIVARDKWLKSEGGFMFPSSARLYLSPFTNEEFYNEKTSFWKNIYGFDFSPMIPYVKECYFKDPLVDTISAEKLLSFSQNIVSIDCQKVCKDDIKDLNVPFKFRSILDATMNGFVCWFDVTFNGDGNEWILSTSPEKEITHWMQTLFYMDEPISMKLDDLIEGSIRIQRSQSNYRCLDVFIQFSCASSADIITVSSHDNDEFLTGKHERQEPPPKRLAIQKQYMKFFKMK